MNEILFNHGILSIIQLVYIEAVENIKKEQINLYIRIKLNYNAFMKCTKIYVEYK